MTHIGGVYPGGDPTLAEIEIQLVECNSPGNGFLQFFEGILSQSDIRLDAVITGEVLDTFLLSVNPRLDIFGFLHHVSGDEAVGNLILLLNRIVKDMPFQRFKQVQFVLTHHITGGLVHAQQVGHIFHIDLSIFIERRGQCLLRHIYRSHLIL